ncbi:MAG: helix-turn-helix domain-containing protein [Candidatus Omnitrophica bacterium]|nr:helix-turn-helix domain-containing protein [Candidatus Omnitrophota bacterium]MBU1047050.1 helix-turn-helix domain-containing protein [Candidatus Omnitrophota bacterium]MBU1630971.1 helix-turn-helix domain-containing protein [Candidatus Omnitrophota bacterium]MBU1767045.1 helix-turn-helix domain-containing protein [Candidatus Omnitrophota bacterium]MBU1889280.1 helix-turn-helix domain-containing protein [Candidatus Omnitrophota bacterium]
MKGINQELGINIRELRTKKGWTQEQFALKAGFHRAYIGQIERGEKNIGIRNLYKIAKVLNISVHKILPSIEGDNKN